MLKQIYIFSKFDKIINLFIYLCSPFFYIAGLKILLNNKKKRASGTICIVSEPFKSWFMLQTVGLIVACSLFQIKMLVFTTLLIVVNCLLSTTLLLVYLLHLTTLRKNGSWHRCVNFCGDQLIAGLFVINREGKIIC